MTTPMQPIQPMRQSRGQVRGFVIIWTFITLIMGLATFLAIFLAARQNVETELPLNQAGPGAGEPVANGTMASNPAASEGAQTGDGS